MVRLRLRRVGRKNQPSFRIVAASKESPRDGKFLEIVGFYNPRTNPETVTFKEDLIYKWLKNGAQPSDAVDRICSTQRRS
jgi:small subunit ribosomal protein S16